MSPTPQRRTAPPPPDELRELHRRLAVVLADVDFPAQRWQLIAGADLYGVDTVTRSLIERAPEQRYHTLPELVTVLGAVLGGRSVTPVTATAPRPQAPPRAPRSGVEQAPRGATRVAHGPRARRPAPGSPRPAA